jgi:hypothetical protein
MAELRSVGQELAAGSPSRDRAIEQLKHDPEKCVAVFRKDHAQTTT